MTEPREISLKKRLSGAVSWSLCLNIATSQRREKLSCTITRYIDSFVTELSADDRIEAISSLLEVLSNDLVWYNAACFSSGVTDGFIEAFIRTIDKAPFLLPTYLTTLVTIATTMSPFAEQHSHHIGHLIAACCRLLTQFPAAREEFLYQSFDNKLFSALTSATQSVGAVAMGRSFVAFSLFRASIEATKRTTACASTLRDMISIIVPEDLLLNEIFHKSNNSRSCIIVASAFNTPSIMSPTHANVPSLIDQVARRVSEILHSSSSNSGNDSLERMRGGGSRRMLAFGLDSCDPSAWMYYSDENSSSSSSNSADQSYIDTSASASAMEGSGRRKNQQASTEKEKERQRQQKPKKQSWFLEELKVWQKFDTTLNSLVSLEHSSKVSVAVRKAPRALTLLDMTLFRVVSWFEKWQSSHRMRIVASAIFNNFAVELVNGLTASMNDIFDNDDGDRDNGDYHHQCAGVWNPTTLRMFLPLWVRGSIPRRTSVVHLSNNSTTTPPTAKKPKKSTSKLTKPTAVIAAKLQRFKSLHARFMVHRFLLVSLLGGAARASVKLSDFVQCLTLNIKECLHTCTMFAAEPTRTQTSGTSDNNTMRNTEGNRGLTARSLMVAVLLIETLAQLLSHIFGGIIEDRLVLSILHDLTSMAISIKDSLHNLNLHSSNGSEPSSAGGGDQYALTHIALDALCSAIAYVLLHRFASEEKLELLRKEEWSYELTSLFYPERVTSSTEITDIEGIHESTHDGAHKSTHDEGENKVLGMGHGHPVLSLLLGTCVLPQINPFEFPAEALHSFLEQLKGTMRATNGNVTLGGDFSEIDLTTLFGPLPLTSSVLIHLAAQWPYQGKHDVLKNFAHIKALVPSPHTLSISHACVLVESAISNLYESVMCEDHGDDGKEYANSVTHRRAMVSAFSSADIIRHVMSFMTYKRVCRLACVSSLFAASAKAPILWRELFIQKFPKLKFESGDTLLGVLTSATSTSGGAAAAAATERAADSRDSARRESSNSNDHCTRRNTDMSLQRRRCCLRCFPDIRSSASSRVASSTVDENADNDDKNKNAARKGQRRKSSPPSLACPNYCDEHDWLALFKERAIATRKNIIAMVLKSSSAARMSIICPFIGCTDVIRSDKNETHMRLHGVEGKARKENKKKNINNNSFSSSPN